MISAKYAPALLSAALCIGYIESSQAEPVPAPNASAAPVALTVILQGVQHDRGSLRVGLYDSAATFRKEVRAFATQQVVAKSGDVDVVFPAVPPGEFAVMAYHDEDGSGALNLRFGMFPIEGYGLSNNPVIVGPPSFTDSAFRIEAATPRELSIKLRY